jgi:RNA polymerase sigma-70 factor (ECF subfamily)
VTRPPEADTPTARFEANRPRLTGLAYRMLGELDEAQDAVQDAWLRWSRHESEVLDPEGWLTRVVVNLCRTRLAALRDRRTDYVGPWLPEPLPTGPGGVDLGPCETATQRETLSLGMLRLLELLSPAERAVVVLYEAFGYAHAEIAELLDLPEATVRQHLHRARERIGAGRRRFEADAERAARLTARFIEAAAGDDLAALEQLLADDVEALSDGGGVASAARRPVAGRTKVARFVAGLAKGATAATVEVEEVNAGIGVVLRVGGQVVVVMQPEFDAATGELVRLSSVLNPAKFRAIPAAPAQPPAR